jgi:tRNA(fMet)-specific endonuclease VapC
MFLIDTDIIIYSLKNDEKVIRNFNLYAQEPKAVSIITIGELLYGAYKSHRKIENLGKVHRIVDIFPVIEISMTVIDTFAHLKAELATKGIVIDAFDLLIGATALSMNYSVVTNNEKHFTKIPGLNIVNWTNGA